MPTPTRYPELAYEKHARNLWRVIDNETGAAIGPLYQSRAELLADLPAFYASRFHTTP